MQLNLDTYMKWPVPRKETYQNDSEVENTKFN